MKQNELRIGNWVDWDEKTIRSEVKGIHPSGNYLHLENGWVQLSRCEPIPLTEEWLVRFGFKESNNYGYFLSPHKDSRSDSSSTRLCFFLEIMDFIVSSNHYDAWYVNCKYVHQLQNLYFALTGEELELK